MQFGEVDVTYHPPAFVQYVSKNKRVRHARRAVQDMHGAMLQAPQSPRTPRAPVNSCHNLP